MTTIGNVGFNNKRQNLSFKSNQPIEKLAYQAVHIAAEEDCSKATKAYVKNYPDVFQNILVSLFHKTRLPDFFRKSEAICNLQNPYLMEMS